MPVSVPNVSCPSPRPIIDYSNNDQLAGVNYCVDGIVQYHMQWPGLTNKPAGFEGNTKSALDQQILGSSPTTPNNGFLLFDSEPWAAAGGAIADYGVNNEATNLTLFRAYSETIWYYSVDLHFRNITFHVYRAPIDVNFTGMGSSSSAVRRSWAANQRKILWQAEHAGMLPALRACRGGIAIPLYLPSTWAGVSRADDLERMIDTTDAVLGEFDIDYVWMPMPVVAGLAMEQWHLDVIVEKCWWRMATWGGGTNLGFPALITTLNNADLPVTVPCDSVEVATPEDVANNPGGPGPEPAILNFVIETKYK